MAATAPDPRRLSKWILPGQDRLAARDTLTFPHVLEPSMPLRRLVAPLQPDSQRGRTAPVVAGHPVRPQARGPRAERTPARAGFRLMPDRAGRRPERFGHRG